MTPQLNSKPNLKIDLLWTQNQAWKKNLIQIYFKNFSVSFGEDAKTEVGFSVFLFKKNFIIKLHK